MITLDLENESIDRTPMQKEKWNLKSELNMQKYQGDNGRVCIQR